MLFLVSPVFLGVPLELKAVHTYIVRIGLQLSSRIDSPGFLFTLQQ